MPLLLSLYYTQRRDILIGSIEEKNECGNNYHILVSMGFSITLFYHSIRLVKLEKVCIDKYVVQRVIGLLTILYFQLKEGSKITVHYQSIRVYLFYVLVSMKSGKQ
jgi:hypothetical protein